MLFWIIAGVLAAVVLATLVKPLLRDAAAPEGAGSDVAIYTAQLAEIERDLARDVLDPTEAERARTEVARRLLAANAAPRVAGVLRSSPVTAILTAIVVMAVSALTYWHLGSPAVPDQPLAQRLAASDAMRANRPDQAALEAAAPTPPPVDAPATYLDSVNALRDAMITRPDDLQGWELLAYHEAELRNYSAAAKAQERVVTLKGDAASDEDLRRQLDLMTLATDGFVSPQAEGLIRQLLDRNPQNVAARYHLGALYDQTDRGDIAFRLWRPLVEDEPDGYHVSLARLQIEGAAARAGIDYTAPAMRGPSAADIANAENLAPEDRAAMIGNMVAGLSDRLATEGGTAADWARLITAHGVLGDIEQAGRIWAEARQVFAADDAAIAMLAEAARNAGLTE